MDKYKKICVISMTILTAALINTVYAAPKEQCNVGSTCNYHVNGNSNRIVDFQFFKKGYTYQCKISSASCDHNGDLAKFTMQNVNSQQNLRYNYINGSPIIQAGNGIKVDARKALADQGILNVTFQNDNNKWNDRTCYVTISCQKD